MTEIDDFSARFAAFDGQCRSAIVRAGEASNDNGNQQTAGASKPPSPQLQT
jgi:hypothetical protein